MQPKPPTSDVKWCIEQLFQYLELDVRNRVAAKTGRAHTLEATKLSNIGSNAALAHPSKTRTSLSAHWRQSAIPVSISADHKAKLYVSWLQKLLLRDVFIHYCSWAQKHGYLYMSRTQFLRMCRDTKLEGPDLDSTAVNLVFEKVHLQSQKQQGLPGGRLGLTDWLRALLHISCALYPDVSPQAAFNTVVEDHVVRYVPPHGAALDRLSEVVMREEVQEALFQEHALLQQIYDYYVNEQELINLGGAGSGRTTRQLHAARQRLPLDSFLRFAQDFELVPRLLTKAQLLEAFKCARFSRAAAAAASAQGQEPAASLEQEDMSRIGFDQFVEAVGRLALLAYNYQDPPEILRAMGFTNSYQAAAKRLWLDDTKQAMAVALMFPDEVKMPAADKSQCIGNEDSPHMDDMLSRAASKVFTKARSTREGYQRMVTARPGVEVMHVHDEPVVLQHERPLHLTTFVSEWVGRPGTPLTETAKLRPTAGSEPLQGQGWCSADTDLPPKYVDRATRMVAARVNREQVSERLKLNHQVQQRNAKLDKLAATKSMRTQLQAAAGQAMSAGDLALYATALQGSQPSRRDAGSRQGLGGARSSVAALPSSAWSSRGSSTVSGGRVQSAPEMKQQGALADWGAVQAHLSFGVSLARWRKCG